MNVTLLKGKGRTINFHIDLVGERARGEAADSIVSIWWCCFKLYNFYSHIQCNVVFHMLSVIDCLEKRVGRLQDWSLHMRQID